MKKLKKYYTREEYQKLSPKEQKAYLRFQDEEADWKDEELADSLDGNAGEKKSKSAEDLKPALETWPEILDTDEYLNSMGRELEKLGRPEMKANPQSPQNNFIDKDRPVSAKKRKLSSAELKLRKGQHQSGNLKQEDEVWLDATLHELGEQNKKDKPN